MMRLIALLPLLALISACASQQTPPPTLSARASGSSPAQSTGSPASSTPSAAAYQPGPKHQKALALIGQEAYPEAASLLEQLVAEEPNNAQAWNDLSLVRQKLGQYGAAADAAERALTIDPHFTFAQFNLGAALLQMPARWREAQEHLQASATAEPDRPEPLYKLGLWYMYAGAVPAARDAFERAHRFKYQPAWAGLVSLDYDMAKRAEILKESLRFPTVPLRIIWNDLHSYLPEGYTRSIQAVLPIRLHQRGETAWAVLERQADRNGQVHYELVFWRPETDQDAGDLDSYLGSCGAGGGPDETPRVQTLETTVGAQLLVTGTTGSVICGQKGRWVTELLVRNDQVQPAQGGILVGNGLYRFVPQFSQYLPDADARALTAAASAIEKAGYSLQPEGRAVWSQVDLGAPGLAIAWIDGVAFVPSGGAPLVYRFTEPGRIAAHSPFAPAPPYKVGQITVPGQQFLAVATHVEDAPNGGAVLVLARQGQELRWVFDAFGDGAGFDDHGVHTGFKHYLPQGGFEVWALDYTWSEAKQTFVPGERHLVSNR